MTFRETKIENGATSNGDYHLRDAADLTSPHLTSQR
jgi:hypothetical protein